MYPLLKSVNDRLTHLEQATVTLREYIQRENMELRNVENFRQRVHQLGVRVDMIEKQMPDELRSSLGLGNTELLDADEMKENSSEEVNVPVSTGPKLTKRSSSKSSSSSVKETAKSSMTRKKSKPGLKPKAVTRLRSDAQEKPTASAPSSPSANSEWIRVVTREELDAAPQYVKGRLTVEKIGTVVGKLNKIVADKYALLGRPYRELSSSEINTWQELKESGCSETEGKEFLTDGEIKGFGKCRMDATAKSVINVLRHVGSLKEVRGKNKARIFIIN